MRTKMYFLVQALACAPLLADAAPSLETFAAYEDIKDASISPDGHYLALISTVEGRRVALVRDLQAGGKVATAMTTDAKGEFDIDWCRWASATRLLCGFQGVAQFLKFSVPHVKLAAADADGKNFKELMDFTPALNTKFDSTVFDPVAEDSKKALVHMTLLPPMGGTFAASLEQPISNFVLDIDTGKYRVKTGFGKGVWNQYSDGRGNLRLADGPDSHARNLYASKSDGASWDKLAKATEFSKSNPLTGLGVNAATLRAYGFADHEGRDALWEFDLDDNKSPVVGFAHPQVDVGGVLLDGRGQLIGVQYETDRPRAEYIDEQLATTMRGINKAMPNAFNWIRSLTDDHKKLIVASRSDTDAGRFQLYDAETHKLSAIGAVYSKLDAQQMARMRAIEYPAADGAKIPGYLLAPLDIRAEKLPLIVMPHSGYEGRTYWRYDMVAQYLVSRGYAVITMNYRGSEGYGKQWLQAGQEDWGGTIYSDITDAARWAVSQGIADPQRICVLGRGASGYSALVGAIRNPEIYKCAASIGGRSDLVDLNKYMRNFSRDKLSEAGEANSQKKENKDNSPQKLAGDVKVPVLLIHGTLDTKTPFTQSEDMAKALERAGKKFKFVKIERADATFWRESERVTLLQELEEFFGNNLRL